MYKCMYHTEKEFRMFLNTYIHTYKHTSATSKRFVFTHIWAMFSHIPGLYVCMYVCMYVFKNCFHELYLPTES